MSVLLSPLQWLSGSSFTVHCGMPPWDGEILNINALGPLHPIKLCFTNLVIALKLCIGFSLKEKSSVCTDVCLFCTLSYTFLWFLTCFLAEMAIPGRLCFYLALEAANWIKLEVSVIWWCDRQALPSTTDSASQKRDGQQVRAPFFPNIHTPQLVAFHLAVPVSVSAEFAGGDLLKLSLRSGSTGCSADFPWIDIPRIPQPRTSSTSSPFVSRDQRENTTTMWEQSWWLSCTGMNHQVQPLAGAVRADKAASSASFHCISAALQSGAHPASRGWIADSLWELCGLCGKRKSEAVRRKGGIFIFGKWKGERILRCGNRK